MIAVPELTYGAQWINFNTFRFVEVYAVVTPMYLVTGYTILLLLRLPRAALCGADAERMELIVQSLPFITKGLAITLQVSVLVVSLSLVAGGLLGVALTYGPLPVRFLVRAYSDIIRGIPMLILIFAVYYGLPALQVNLSNLTAAVAALTCSRPPR